MPFFSYSSLCWLYQFLLTSIILSSLLLSNWNNLPFTTFSLFASILDDVDCDLPNFSFMPVLSHNQFLPFHQIGSFFLLNVYSIFLMPIDYKMSIPYSCKIFSLLTFHLFHHSYVVYYIWEFPHFKQHRTKEDSSTFQPIVLFTSFILYPYSLPNISLRQLFMSCYHHTYCKSLPLPSRLS